MLLIRQAHVPFPSNGHDAPGRRFSVKADSSLTGSGGGGGGGKRSTAADRKSLARMGTGEFCVLTRAYCVECTASRIVTRESTEVPSLFTVPVKGLQERAQKNDFESYPGWTRVAGETAGRHLRFAFFFRGAASIRGRLWMIMKMSSTADSPPDAGSTKLVTVGAAAAEKNYLLCGADDRVFALAVSCAACKVGVSTIELMDSRIRIPLITRLNTCPLPSPLLARSRRRRRSFR